METKKLEILLSVIEAGSLSKASESVGYTQSGLTHLIDGLEKEIGLTLLKRCHSGISLTKEGEVLLPAIRQILAANDTLDNKIKELNRNESDSIRIAAYSSIAMHWMPEILYRFRRECPDVTVELRMVDHALEPFELLEDKKTDVIFASRHDEHLCEWTTLYREKMYAILPKDYPVRTTESFPLTDFEGCDFLMPYGRFDLDVNRAFEENGVRVNAVSTHVDDETVIRMVGKGLGVSMMTELMIRGRVDDVLCLPIEPMIPRELGMGLPAGVRQNESIRKLKQCVISFMKERRE